MDIMGGAVAGAAIIALGFLLAVGFVSLGLVLHSAARGRRRAHPVCRACSSPLSHTLMEHDCPGCQMPLGRAGTRAVFEPPRWAMLIASVLLIVLGLRLPWWVMSAMS